MNNKLVYLCTSFFLFILFKPVQITASNPILIDSTTQYLDISSMLSIYAEATMGMTFDEVKCQPFRPIISKSTPRLPDKPYWTKFNVLNSSNTPVSILICDYYRARSDLYIESSSELKHYEMGSLINFYDRVYRYDQHCSPITLESDINYEFIVRSWDLNGSRYFDPLISLQTEAFNKTARKERMDKRLPLRINRVIFLSIIFFLILIWLIHICYNLDAAIIFYTTYLLFVFLYYFRHLERSMDLPLVFLPIAAWNYNIEISNAYLIKISYGLFVYFFLNIHRTKKLKQPYDICLTIAILIFLVDLIIQMIWGIDGSYQFYKFSRVILSVIAIYIITLISRSNNISNGKFILIGTLLMIFPALLTFYKQIFPGFETSLCYGLFRKYNSYNGIILYAYSIHLGFLLEVLVFSAGLNYKGKQDRKQRIIDTKSLEVYERIKSKTMESLRLKIEEQLLDDTLKFVKSHYYKPYVLNDMAKAFSMSRAKLFHVIKQKTGMSPLKYLNEIKMALALDLLINTELSISEISDKLSYAGPAYFSTFFKKELKMTPSKARKSYWEKAS